VVIWWLRQAISGSFSDRITGNKELKSYLATHPPDPLPLVREGGSVGKRGGEAPSLKLLLRRVNGRRSLPYITNFSLEEILEGSLRGAKPLL
jgi:hypothetical protein